MVFVPLTGVENADGNDDGGRTCFAHKHTHKVKNVNFILRLLSEAIQGPHLTFAASGLGNSTTQKQILCPPSI